MRERISNSRTARTAAAGGGALRASLTSNPLALRFAMQTVKNIASMVAPYSMNWLRMRRGLEQTWRSRSLVRSYLRDASTATSLDTLAAGGPSRKLHDHCIDRQRIPFSHQDLLHRHVAFRAQHVLHLHRFDHAERFAGLHFLPFRDQHRLDQAGHRAEQRLGRIRRLFRWHQRGEFGLTAGIDARFDI